MDLLDFEATELYFEKRDSVEVEKLIAKASHHYSDGEAELPLLQAFLRAPDSLNVLVALNRFYYYQHRLGDALLISERAFILIAVQINFPVDWQKLTPDQVLNAPKEQLGWIRLYLFTLKSIAFLNMRLLNLQTSQAILQKLVAADSKDRIGASALLELVNQELEAL